jgi:hypothetical protein
MLDDMLEKSGERREGKSSKSREKRKTTGGNELEKSRPTNGKTNKLMYKHRDEDNEQESKNAMSCVWRRQTKEKNGNEQNPEKPKKPRNFNQGQANTHCSRQGQEAALANLRKKCKIRGSRDSCLADSPLNHSQVATLSRFSTRSF